MANKLTGDCKYCSPTLSIPGRGWKRSPIDRGQLERNRFKPAKALAGTGAAHDYDESCDTKRFHGYKERGEKDARELII